jgi:hypothetical protein
VYIEKLLPPPPNYSLTATCAVPFIANNLNETNFIPGHPVFDRICNTPFRVAIFPCYLVADKEGMRKQKDRRVREIYIFKKDIQNLINERNIRQESRMNVKLIMFLNQGGENVQ